MKYVKLLGLAAAVALILTALLGAASASATVLCTEYATPCPKGEDYEPGTKLDATLEGSSVFSTTGGSILNTCTTSTIQGKTSTTGGVNETVFAVLTTLTFGGCTGKTVEQLLGELEIHYIVADGNATKGTLTIKSTTMTMELFGASCIYGTGAALDVGTITSDDSMTYATIDLKGNLTKQQGSFFCPNILVWEASYNITEPKPLYIKPKMEGE